MQCSVSHYILDNIFIIYKSINGIIKYSGNNEATITFKIENENLFLLEDPYYEYSFINYKTIYDFEEMMRNEKYVIKFIQWQQYILIQVIDKVTLKCYMNASPINYFTQSTYKKFIELIYNEYPIFIKKPAIGYHSLYMLYPKYPITIKLYQTTDALFVDNLIIWYKERYNNNKIEYNHLDMIFDYYLEQPIKMH
jgi:hypothetical protein